MANKVTPGLYIGSLLASGLMALALFSPQVAASADAGAKSVQVHVFDILRNGDPVGTHEVRKERSQRGTTVRVNSTIEIKFLGFTAYRFEYSSEETWDDRGLKQLTVWVDNDGKEASFDGKRTGGSFKWSTDAGGMTLPLPLYPTNHWNAAVLDQTRVLNTLTGELDHVRISPLGRESVRLPGTTIAATRYRYQGDLDLDSWYDDQGRWIAMRFQGDDGSTIEYVCRDCQDGTMM